jgi:tripartite-type tricarboxylate transporter receptor subunit TctC
LRLANKKRFSIDHSSVFFLQSLRGEYYQNEKGVQMKPKKLSFFSKIVFAVTAVGLFAESASAQAFPNQPLTLVVGFAPGGSTDLIARALAAAMEKKLGQPVKVENIAGQGGAAGPRDVARAAPDGYRLLVGNVGMVASKFLYRKEPFDVVRDFDPIGLINEVPLVLVARKELPAKNLKELIATIKANPTTFSVASAGPGSAAHLCGLVFLSSIKLSAVNVPYRGSAPAMADLVENKVDLLCGQTTSTVEEINAKRVTPIIVSTPKRVMRAPFELIPTGVESGLPGFQMSVWHGLFTPKGITPELKKQLTVALQESLSDPNVVKIFNELGTSIANKNQATPAYLANLINKEIDKWGPIIKKSGQFID